MKCQTCNQDAALVVSDALTSESWALCETHALKMLHSTLDAYAVGHGTARGWDHLRERMICEPVIREDAFVEPSAHG